MEVFYVNHKNEKIDLGKPPYQLQISDLFNYAHRYEGNNNRISRIYRDVTEISANLTIEADTEHEFCECVNRFYEVVEVDTVANVSGKLYIGDYYLLCNIVASSKAFWSDLYNGMDNKVRLLTPYPLWCREIQRSFYKNNAAYQAVTLADGSAAYLMYPYGYPYMYSSATNVSYLQNDHYSACGFKMVIYGPCENPAIRIDNHLYEVQCSVLSDEYVVVDTRDNTIKKYAADGTIKNLFNARNKKSDIFAKIPAGALTVSWNLAFGFDVILFQERSEPKWSL